MAHNWTSKQDTLALHLRSADRGKNYIGPLLQYVKLDPELASNADRVFVATDDKEAVHTLALAAAADRNRQDVTQQRLSSSPFSHDSRARSHEDTGTDSRGSGRLTFADAIFDDREDRRQHVVIDILNAQDKASKSSRTSSSPAAASGESRDSRQPSAKLSVNATQLTFEAIKNIAFLAAGQYFIGTVDSGFSEVAAALSCVAGEVRREPMYFGHWKRGQNPREPPVSSSGTSYYAGASLPLGVRASSATVFNLSDFSMHALLPTA